MYKPLSLLKSQHLVGLSKKRVYLIYEDRESHWWSKFFKKGFKHVYCITFDGLFWIKMDYLLGYTDLDVLCYDYHDTINDVLEGQKVTIQYVEVWRKPRYRVRSLFAPASCVEAMKAILGVRASLVISPYQLYKHIGKYHG